MFFKKLQFLNEQFEPISDRICEITTLVKNMKLAFMCAHAPTLVSAEGKANLRSMKIRMQSDVKKMATKPKEQS